MLSDREHRATNRREVRTLSFARPDLVSRRNPQTFGEAIPRCGNSRARDHVTASGIGIPNTRNMNGKVRNSHDCSASILPRRTMMQRNGRTWSSPKVKRPHRTISSRIAWIPRTQTVRSYLTNPDRTGTKRRQCCSIPLTYSGIGIPSDKREEVYRCSVLCTDTMAVPARVPDCRYAGGSPEITAAILPFRMAKAMAFERR